MASSTTTSTVCIILLSVSLLADNVQSTCDSIGLQNCISTLLAPMLPYLLGRNGTKVNSTLLDIGCNISLVAQSCVAKTGCTSADNDYQIFWAGYNDALTYICSEKEDFLAYQNCLDLPGYNQQMTICIAGKRPYDYTETCTRAKDQLSCLVNYLVTNNKCTTETFVRTSYTKLVKPRLDLQNCGACKLTDPPSTCIAANLIRCVEVLRPFARYLPGPYGQKVTPDILNSCCSILNSVLSCVGATGCTSADQSYQLYWAGYNGALLYICSAKQDFISYQSCLDKPGYNQSMDACLKIDYSDLCNSSYGQLSCLINYLVNTTQCTTETLVRNYFVKISQPTLDVRTCGSCKLSGGVSKIQSSILLVAAGLILKCILGLMGRLISPEKF